MAVASDPQKIRGVLEKILKDKDVLRKSALLSFKQFDRDGSNSLDEGETFQLLQRLCKNLQLPPIDADTVGSLFAKYDDGDGQLTMNEFVKLYHNLLYRVRDKYFPEKKLRVRRKYFVGQTSLSGSHTIKDHFVFEKKLGAGSFGQVHLVKDKGTQLQRVCKIINKDRAQLPVEQIQAEIEFMKTLDHPNIIKIFEVYEDYNSIYIIMEICSGGELQDRIEGAQERRKRLNERYTAHVFQQIMEALTYFHAKKIAHKDLKPENIMFQDKTAGSQVKIIDFGVAEMFSKNTVSAQAAGTALYMAPEVWKRRFNLKCDIWSAGCILYQMVTCCLPFDGRTMEEVQHKICFTEPDFHRQCQGISADCLDLIRRMLVKEPNKRPSSAQVLKHAWFKNAPETTMTLTPEVLGNLEKYMKGTAVKHALANLLTHQLNVNGSQIRKLIKLFRTLDKDSSGTLSHTELTQGLESVGWSKWEINKIVQTLDMDDSGQIAYTEFMTACYTWQEDEINIIWGAFSKMDASGDGKISISELVKVLSGEETKFGEKEEIKRLVEEIDRDGNGYVDWDEFLSYMKG